MAIRQLNPYLNFNGDAAQAIATYQRVLGAQLEGDISRFGDQPGVPEEARQRIMHARLRLGGGLIMISDGNVHQPVNVGDNVHVALDFDDLEEMARCFDGLARGGTVKMALTDTFWGARFGMLVDAFGISWMFNGELKK
jgi:PhnB protein